MEEMFLFYMALIILLNILQCYNSPLQLCDAATSGADATAFTHPSPVTPRTVSMAGRSLSQSVFHCRKPQVLTATAGDLVVWDLMEEDLTANQSLSIDRMKLIHFQKDPITALTVTDR